MKRLFLLLFCLFLCEISFSQGEFNNWYFGFNCGITFNTNPPSAVTNGAVHVYDQTSTISDAAGNLIMYSDGQNVYNRNHAQMPNGFNMLTTGTGLSHASIIARKPGSLNLFYIFTIASFGYPDGFKYGIIDMNLQGGNGDVISKNNQLATPVCEKLTAVKHSNGTDIWIIVHLWNSDAFYAYLLTAAGINSPVITHIGLIHNGSNGNVAGQLVANNDGTKIALGIFFMDVFEVFDFDNSTGVLSNELQIPGYPKAWGVQFSPDNSKLYTSQWSLPEIHQFNMNAGTPAAIINSATLVGVATSPDPTYEAGFLQLAPDNKIYIAKMNAGYVSIINNPNALGTACNFVDNGLYLAGKTCQAGLPNYIQTSFSIPDFTYQNYCQGDSTIFQIQNLTGFNSFLWNFGDPASVPNNVSTIPNPSHYYNNPSTYTITLIAQQGSIIDTIQHSITIHPLPQVNLGNDTTICSEENVTLHASGGTTYSWLPSASLNNGSIANPIATPEVTTTYTVTVNSGGCTASAAVKVTVSDCSLTIPNVFTPNGDLINDYFEIIYKGFHSYHVIIFNRWGVKLFESNDKSIHWNGKTPNKHDAAEGVYYFILTIGSKSYNGTVTLLR